MISQSLFLELGFRVGMSCDCPDELRDEMAQFVRPHVLVIHHPSSRGFYLSIDLRHIISVCCCRIPENPAKIALGCLPRGSSLPPWVMETRGTCIVNDYSEFDSFWLY